MNPLLLATMMQVAKSQAKIGYKDDATRSVRDSCDKALDRGSELTPEQILQIFEVWAPLDPQAATAAV